MKTLQEQYNLIKEGKGQKSIFLTEAKKQFPNMVTNPMGFEETTKILKNRGVISENYVDLQPINSFEATPKTSWENKFALFLAEEAKAEEKKTTKEVEEKAEKNFDYKDKKNLDNQIAQEVQNGIYFEAKENPDKTLEEIKDIVSKNLAKDGQYYMNNAMFGVKDLKAEQLESEEVSGKHKESGYSDKLKKVVKEALTEGKKKQSVDSELAEIDKQAEIVAMEAKLDKVDEMIAAKNERLTMVSEDENLSELVDKKAIKTMQREIKILEKRKAKMEKMYEKMCGKSYKKEEIVDEAEVEELQEMAAEDLELKSMAKQAFLSVKKQGLRPQYITDDSYKWSYDRDVKNNLTVGILVKDGILTISIPKPQNEEDEKEYGNKAKAIANELTPQSKEKGLEHQTSIGKDDKGAEYYLVRFRKA